MSETWPHHPEEDEEDIDEEEAFLNFVCGWTPDGGCTMAGTEECDWECPRRR